MKHFFWHNCSFRKGEARLTERGIARPLVVSRARSGGSHAPPPSADADVSRAGSSGHPGSGALSIMNAAKSLLSLSRSYDL